jgi:hypothetical protein
VNGEERLHRVASRGIVSFPYANRPLNLIWVAPTGLLAGFSLRAYFATHVAYLAASGALVFLLARRLLPALPRFAFVAATTALVFAPYDVSRLNAVQMGIYSGFTFGALSALVLLIESWLRGSRLVLVAAAGVGFVTARSYEATLPLLVIGAPLLLLCLEGRWSRRLS